MFRIVTIEREFGCGGGVIAARLADQLGWNLWDQALTEEIAKVANVDCAVVQRCDERVDSPLHRLAKTFWRGSYERRIPISDSQIFDTDCMVNMAQDIMERIAREGNAVVVGRGAPFFLRGRDDAFHVFMYAPREVKIRRLVESGREEAEAAELVETVDRERIAYIKHYFDADWPTRALYHLMVNTAMGEDSVITTILNTMRLLEESPRRESSLHKVI
ncbi:MAG TPA: cytidylate kinase-like family protein [Terriglobales bacterium]|nr:cytidylate kinase-like family protein [Terriglobales bacterium]